MPTITAATTTAAAAAAAAALEAAWGCLTLTAAGSGGLWAEHVSRQAASLIWKRWYVAPSGVTYQMRVEPGDPRFQF